MFYKSIKNKLSAQSGFAILEVLVVIGVISLVIVSVSQVAVMAKKANQAGKDRTQALSYAQEWLEIMTAIKNNEFACRCLSGDICTTDTCTRSADARSCGIFPAYQSCWTKYPKNLYGVNEFKLANSGGWQLLSSGGAFVPCPDTRFSRRITITNLAWDADGRIAAAGGTVDDNTKEVAVTVRYGAAPEIHEVSLKTILTAWENLN